MYKNEEDRRRYEANRKPRPPAYFKEYYRRKSETNPEYFLVKSARQRAKEKGYECDIDASDIKIPDYCPILGVKLEVRGGRNSPTLDRKDPKRGYTKDNVWVVSKLANVMKSDASLEELRSFSKWVQTLERL